MNLRTLKTWHWIIIGLVAGAVIGITRAMWAMQAPVGGRGFISQHLFEEALHAPATNGQSYVTDVVIHPCPATGEIDLVALKAFDADADRYRDYFFAAPRPFVPAPPAASRDGETVSDYLRELAAANPSLRPRYAWWDATSFTVSFYALLGCAVIGGVWPGLIKLTGGLEPKDPAYDLDRFGHAPEGGKPVASEIDKAHLRELEEELEHNPEGADIATQAAIAASPAAIRKLEYGRLEAPGAEAHDLKDFAGEYYPVEKKHVPHAFSLVELIVVIGIIMLLIAFAMPALQYAQKSAETVKCAAQLRSIGQALHAYASDNKGSLPAWSVWHTWPPDIDGDSYGPAWTIELIPYIGKPDSPVYNCPSFPRPGKWRNYFLESQWSGRSGHSSMKLTDITMVGRFVLSGDTSNLGHFPTDPKQDDSDPDDFGGGMLVFPSDGGAFMHLGGNNVLFDDGHVSLYAHFNPREMTFNPHRMQGHDEVTPD